MVLEINGMQVNLMPPDIERLRDAPLVIDMETVLEDVFRQNRLTWKRPKREDLDALRAAVEGVAFQAPATLKRS